MNAAESHALAATVDRLAHRLARVGEQAWIRDTDHRFYFVNQAFARSMGTPRADLEGRPDHDLFAADEARSYRRSDRHCRQILAPLYFEEAGERDALLDTLKYPLILPSGGVAGVVGIACPFPAAVGPVDPPIWLREAKRLLAARFASPPSIGGLARGLGISPDHLARAFKRHYGMGVHEYVRTLRVQWCSWSLLEDPDRSLADLAVLAGFADQSHLTREFRRARGITPGRLRNRWRQTWNRPGLPLRLAPDRPGMIPSYFK
jgi:AraC-like DNA-binding protein